MNAVRFFVLGTFALLAACSGGDHSSANDGAGMPPQPSANINSANAARVTRVSYQAAMSSAEIGELTNDTGLIANSSGDTSKIGSKLIVNAKAGASAYIPIPPTTDYCIPSGSMTISGEIADPFTPTLTANDYFDVQFDMCDDGFSVTDGHLHYIVSAFTGDFLGGIYDLTMDATLDTFQVATAEDVLTSNGDAKVRLDTSLTPFIAVEVGGTSLTIDRNASSETQTEYASRHTADAGLSPSPYTQTSSGTLQSTQFEGVVRYSTPTMFEGFDADYPHTGVFLVTGDVNSARLTAIDNVNIVIEIIANSSGMVLETINTTWAALEGS